MSTSTIYCTISYFLLGTVPERTDSVCDSFIRMEIIKRHFFEIAYAPFFAS